VAPSDFIVGGVKGLPLAASQTDSHTRRRGRLYRYYVSQSVLKNTATRCTVGRIPAGEVEAAVIDQLRVLLRAPEIIVGTWRKVRHKRAGLSEASVRQALTDLDPLTPAYWYDSRPCQ
jgi:site-specific DNA recombinase